MKNYQGERPSLYDFAQQFSQLTVPTLIMVGDEDDPLLHISGKSDKTLIRHGIKALFQTLRVL